MLSTVERVYANTRADPGFAAVFGACQPADAESLAELIEADGRLRLRRGKAVDLERYLTAVPDLEGNPDALDAAIDIALRGISGSGRITPESVEQLVARYPSFAEPIRETASLNAAVWSTSGLRRRIAPPPVRQLPCDFGPRLPSGHRRYMLAELLGQGSFGQVYKATDRQLSEEGGGGHRAIVAIKVLADATRTPLDRQRLIDEATKVRRISHPNVVQVLDRGVSEDDEDFIVYEHVDGGDLSDLRDDQLPLDPSRAAAVMEKIARGVHAAHSAGVIHCDLKPSNIMLTGAGEPKVADFGIAIRLEDRAKFATIPGSDSRGPIGNIAFISPEQFRSEDAALSVPSDVYALGGMLFHLLTGQLPNGATRSEIARTHDRRGGRTRAPSARSVAQLVDRDLDAICRRALAPEAHDRYDSAASLAVDLEHWLAREPVAWTQPSAARRLGLWTRRKPGLAVAGAAILLLTIAGVAVAWHFAAQSQQRRVQAAIAEMELERKQADDRFRAAIGAVVKSNLGKIKQDERFLTDMLFSVWLFEYIYGPKALDSPTELQEIWSQRESAVRMALAARRATGSPDTFETLMMEQLLGFWMVSRGEYAESAGLLEHNLAAWKTLLPDDPMVRDTQMMRTCAEVNRVRAEADQGTPPDPTALTQMEHALDAELARLNVERPRSAQQYLALSRLADIYDLQDRSIEAADSRTRIKALLNDSQLKGTIPATRPETTPAR